MAWLLGLLPTVLNWVTTYLSAVKNAQVAMYQARFGAAAGVAEAAIAGQAQVQVRWWFAALPPAMIGMWIALYIGKEIFYDKVIGSFVGCSGHPPLGTCTTFATDPLSDAQNWLLMAVVSGYFGHLIADKFLSTKT